MHNGRLHVWLHVSSPNLLYRFCHRWEDNIRMDFREIGWENVDWIHLTQDRNQWRTLVNKVMYPRVP